MDVDELVGDGEKDIHGVDHILLAGWAAVVEKLEKSVETVADKEAQDKTDDENVLGDVILEYSQPVHLPPNCLIDWGILHT